MKKNSILLIDDDDSLRRVIEFSLTETGHKVQPAASGEEGLRLFESSSFDAVITDITMPGMSGPELQRQLAFSGQAIPIVFITAHGGETLRPRLIADGAVECLSRPFSDTALRLALNSAFRKG